MDGTVRRWRPRDNPHPILSDEGTGSLWKDYFRDPSLWWDNRNSKASPRYPDFKHKLTKECLWILGWYNPPWVRQELRRRGLQPLGKSVAEVTDGVAPATQTKESHRSLLQGGRSKADVLITNVSRPYKLQESIAYVGLLKACGEQKDVIQGSRIHADIFKRGLVLNSFTGNALVNMYAKCGALAKAQQVFDDLPIRDLVSWTALITGYAQHGHGKEALHAFELMQCDGLPPDAMTFSSILKACGSIGAIEKGKKLHSDIVRGGLLEKDFVLSTALVGMYAKCGALANAQQLFDELPVRNVVSWTALIAGYAQHGHGKEALICFEQMQCEGFSPDALTFASVLKACGSMGATEKGQEIHAEIVKEGLLLRSDSVLGTALVDMYAKCGALAKAQEAFYELPVWNVATWNALIAGYSQHGHGKEALKHFEWMQQEGTAPDAVTFLCILSACSCSGLVDEGQIYFNAMSTNHGIDPTLEHYTCMVDLFARRGHFDKALALIEKMPSSDYLPVWFALLSACRKWENVELGRWAFDRTVQVEEKSAVAYVYMSNIYAGAGMQEDADKVEALRMKNESWKVPGRCWWTDVNGYVHSFSVGDKEHFETPNIYAKLEEVLHKLSQEGYCPDLHPQSHEIANVVEEADGLCEQGEKS